MDSGEDTPAVGRLLRERAQGEWLRGEAEIIWVSVPVGQVMEGRYRVRGLDRDGDPRRPLSDRVADGVLDVVIPDEYGDPRLFTVVQGGAPNCLAVGLYEAVAPNHTWLTITPHRVAVLRLRDQQNAGESALDQFEARFVTQQRPWQEGLRGVAKLVASGAAETVKSLRRPPLEDRPQDAVLSCPFEAPYGQLHSITPWKPRLMPQVRGGPRHVHVQFMDGSWTRVLTDAQGADALTGQADRGR